MGLRRITTKWLRVSWTALLFSGTVLVVALVLYLALGGGNVRESKYVKSNQFQAVFLSNDKVYFGRITSLTNKFIRLQDIFYLRQGQTAQSQSTVKNPKLVLIKLGCELYGPDDELVFNKDQVQFWQNIKNDAAVVKKIVEFKRQNPNGQKCNPVTP